MRDRPSKFHRLLAAFLSVLVPGWGQVYLGWYIMAFTLQAILFFVVLGSSWSRLALNPDVLFTVGILVAGIHVVAAAGCWAIKTGQARKSYGFFAGTILFPILFVNLAAVIYYHRQDWLGIGLYHVPTQSMAPSIQPGDLVIVDTWAYRQAPVETGDIVLFAKPGDESRLLIKRVEEISAEAEAQGRIRLFLTGDNADSSSDSRHFGWVDVNSLRGRVRQILLSYSNQGFYFSRRGVIDQRNQ